MKQICEEGTKIYEGNYFVTFFFHAITPDSVLLKILACVYVGYLLMFIVWVLAELQSGTYELFSG